jgi:sugar diacid utilization regulator
MTIPREVAAVLRPVLPSLAEELISAIGAEVPEYSRAMSGGFGRGVRLGVEIALGRFVDTIEQGTRVQDTADETYVNLGRGELHAGRSLDALLRAYRVGARVAWRRFVDAGVAGGLEPEVIYRVGEAIFEYIDELSAESAEGFAEEQMAEAGERRRRRRRLVRLLAQDPPADPEDVRAAAAEVGWELPRRVAVLVAPAATTDDEGLEVEAERVGRTLALGTVAAAVDGVVCAMVPDPDAPGRRRQIEAAAGDGLAALGPAVPWPQAARSLRRAQAALRLAGTGPLPGHGLVVAEEHLADLLMRADPLLGAELAAHRLAPLEGLAAGTGRRLRETLRAWLDRPGQVQAVAAELDVHPQTVRYRVRQLRELFGEALEDPDGRFELALALRAAGDDA